MSVNALDMALRTLRKPATTNLARLMVTAGKLRETNPLTGYSEAVLNEITPRGYRFRDELIGRRRSAMTKNRKALREARRKAAPHLALPGREHLRREIDNQLNCWHIHQIETYPVPILRPIAGEQPLDWGQQQALNAFLKDGLAGFLATTEPLLEETQKAA